MPETKKVKYSSQREEYLTLWKEACDTGPGRALGGDACFEFGGCGEQDVVLEVYVAVQVAFEVLEAGEECCIGRACTVRQFIVICDLTHAPQTIAVRVMFRHHHADGVLDRAEM